MAKASSPEFPLQEKVRSSNALKRASDVVILLLLLSLLAYRLLHIRSRRHTWVLAFLCEAWFTFVWLLTANAKWNQVKYKTYPGRLSERFPELPQVDMFVTTADSMLEPPIITVDTVLSLMAVDYPADKLACYVSDDGASAVTFYSLVEASRFAKLWVPFCKKYNVRVRAPSFYFSTGAQVPPGSSSDFSREWRLMKEEYEELSRIIEEAVEGKIPLHVSKDTADFWKIERGNHPSIVKVMAENKEHHPNGLPHLVYVAREKRPKCPHNFKAGAMNVLTRVSGVMTNAPFILNVDCDMFANDPQIILHAMCLLLGSKTERDSGFVQFPQHFRGRIKDDPFGNSHIVLQTYLGHGIAGLQGPMYGGTGCVHRRKIIYGQQPIDHQDMQEATLNLANGESSWEILRRKLGPSPELLDTAAKALYGRGENTAPRRQDISGGVRAAMEVAGCHYETLNGTSWGQEVGWVYGLATEDVLTGLKIHSMGWRSAYCAPDPPGFLGCAPTGGPSCLTQMKRWATGLAEILFSRHSPLLATLTKKLQFRQCLGYFLICIWGLRSIPELCYSLLPAYCLLTSASFLPKVEEPAVVIPAVLFVFYHLYTLQEFIACDQTVKAWWNNLRMGRITSTTAWLFGSISVAMKLLGLSDTMFEITRKDQNPSGFDHQSEDPGRFTFDASPIFVPGVAFVLVHFTAFAAGLWKMLAGLGSSPHFGLGEIACSVWLLSAFLPFIKGLFRKGCYGIPWTTIFKAAVLALLFFIFCTRTR